MEQFQEFVKIIRSKKSLFPVGAVDVVAEAKKIFAPAEGQQLPDISKISMNPAEHNSTPIELVNYISKLFPLYNSLRYLVDRWDSFTPIHFLQTEEEAIADLKAIQSEVANNKLYLDSARGHITFIIPISMYDPTTDFTFDFGFFKVTMTSKEVFMVPAGNNKEKLGYYHPYLRDNKLCLGGYADPYTKAIAGMSFFAAFSLFKQCTMNYSGDALNGTKDGPHQGLINWIGQRCNVCDAVVPNEDIVLCESTNKPICPECIKSGTCTDMVNKTYHIPSFLAVCEVCGEKTSGVVRKKCLSCRKQTVKL